MKSFLKKVIPEFIINFFTGFFYGWKGDYDSWLEAKKKCTGYNNPVILKKVEYSTLKVLKGEAAYERDSVVFKKQEFSYSLMTFILWAAIQNNNNLNVMDFGGSLGSTYFQHSTILNSLDKLNWCVVEQPEFAELGKSRFSNKRLHFFNSIHECLSFCSIDLVLLSSVLQYLEKPYDLLNEIIAFQPGYIIIDRTPFIDRNDRITIQRVHPAIYKASYPCWFFNKEKFIHFLSLQYELIDEFNALDRANIKSEFKGFLFKLKKKA